MMALVNARDEKHLDIIISNGLREAARILQKEVDGTPLTSKEKQRKMMLQQVDSAIEAIRSASNALESMNPVPEDYKDNKYWPAI